MGGASSSCNRRKRGAAAANRDLETSLAPDASGNALAEAAAAGPSVPPQPMLGGGPASIDVEDPKARAVASLAPIGANFSGANSAAVPTQVQHPAEEQLIIDIDYCVTLEATEDAADPDAPARLGVEVEPVNDCFLRVDRITVGRIADWNEAHSDGLVTVGDCIVEANGIRGDATALIHACKQPGFLSLVLVRRPPPPYSKSRQLTSAVSRAKAFSSLSEGVSGQSSDDDDDSRAHDFEEDSQGDGELDGELEHEDFAPIGQLSFRTPKGFRPEDCHEFEIVLDRRSGVMLGIDVVPADTRTTPAYALLVEGIRTGIVEQWNNQQEVTPEKRVQPGDWIIAANHVREDVQKIIDQCKECTQDLKLVLRRAPPAEPVTEQKDPIAADLSGDDINAAN